MEAHGLKMTIVDNITHAETLYCKCQLRFTTKPLLDDHIKQEMAKSGQVTL